MNIFYNLIFTRYNTKIIVGTVVKVNIVIIETVYNKINMIAIILHKIILQKKCPNPFNYKCIYLNKKFT